MRREDIPFVRLDGHTFNAERDANVKYFETCEGPMVFITSDSGGFGISQVQVKSCLKIPNGHLQIKMLYIRRRRSYRDDRIKS